MKATKRTFLDQVAEAHPELAQYVGDIKRDYASGLIRPEPRTYKECQNWRDAWLYLFRRGHRAPGHHMKTEGERIIRVAFVGKDFTEGILTAMERIAQRLGPSPDLKDFRLINTSIKEAATRRIQAMFPVAKISFYSLEDKERDPTIMWVNE